MRFRLTLQVSFLLERFFFCLPLLVLLILFASCGGGRGRIASPGIVQPSSGAISSQYELPSSSLPASSYEPSLIPDDYAVSRLLEPPFSLFLIDKTGEIISDAPLKLELLQLTSSTISVKVVASENVLGFKGFSGFLRFDGSRFSVSSVIWDPVVLPSGSSLTLSSELPSHLALAGVILPGFLAQSLSQGAEVVQVIFAESPQSMVKSVSLAPKSERNKVFPELKYVSGRLVVSFEGRNIGDYNLDGIVNINEIWILADRFFRSRQDADWGPRDEVVDGNGSGKIDIGDVMPIAENFFTRLSGYDIELAFIPEGSQQEPIFERLENPGDPQKPTLEFYQPAEDEGWPSFSLILPDLGYGTYYAKAIPIGKSLEDRGVESDVVSYELVNLPPPPPANFHLVSFTKNSVTLGWDFVALSDVVGYHIYYSLDVNSDELSEFTRANAQIIPRDTNEFTVTGLATDTTYYFVISSEDSGGLLSEISAILATRLTIQLVDVAPAPPADFRVIGTDYTSVTLAWAPSAETDVIGYNIYYTDIEGAQFTDFTLAPSMPLASDVTEFTVEGLNQLTTYYFVISAIDEAMQESPEADIMATLISAVTVVYPVAVASIIEKEQYGKIYEDYAVTFSAGGSYSPAGASLVEFTWDFGDGTPAETVPSPGTARHAYPDPSGGYTVTLTVKDEFGAEASVSIPTGAIAELTETRILLVWNTNSPDVDGVIKDYYGSPYTGRGIPQEFVLGLPLSMNEEIDRASYENTIRDPIRNYLTNTIYKGNSLKHTIYYIVTCKDVPLKIRGVNEFDFYNSTFASVDSELCVLFEGVEGPGPVWNAYYAAFSSNYEDKGNMAYSQPFTPFFSVAGRGTTDYLVTRLSGYTVSDVLSAIDRAKNPYSGNDYLVVLDDVPGRTIDWMHDPTADGTKSAFDVLNKWFLLMFDDDTNRRINALDLGDGYQKVIGYCSHGKHSGFVETYILDPATDDQATTGLGFGYLNGALFNTYESFNGHSFVWGQRRGQGMIADFIRMGGTGGIGNVYEPFSVGVGDESVLFAEYLQGRNLAEACYKGIRFLSWQEVVVGDPLCTVNVQ